MLKMRTGIGGGWPKSTGIRSCFRCTASSALILRKGSCWSAKVENSVVTLTTRARTCVYIDRLATAPWNRPRFVTDPKYKGVGQLLFAAAVNLSLDEGLEGRIGLHALPNAEGFYRDVMELTDFGSDQQCYGLCYFELSSNQAATFLETPES